METLKDLLTPKTFNRISYVAVICWILFGAILLGIFAEMENSEPRFDFRCDAKSEKMDLVRGKCFEQYEKQYNKSGVPPYGFVIVNFSLIGIVCVIYSQVVKSIVDEVAANGRSDAERQNNDSNRPKTRRLFVAYFCQLAIRFLLGVLFIVLQTQFFYPAKFPAHFHCQIAGGSHAANASSTGNIQNSTMYECHNQRATKKTFWMHAVTVVNGAFALIILLEIICILSRVRKEKKFLEDSQFLADYLPPQEPLEEPAVSPPQEPRQEPLSLPQEPRQEPEQQDPQQEDNEEIPLLQNASKEQLPSSFIESLKNSIIKNTEKPAELKALFQNNPGEGERIEDMKMESIYTNLLLIRNRAEYDFTGNREEQLKVFPKPKEHFKPIKREDIVDGRNKKILVVGRPGIGKTLFCKKFVRDCALGRVVNAAELHFAFFLKFRKFNSVGELSLRELLESSEYSPSECLSDQDWSYILKNPDKVLMVFDGLDEFLDIESIAVDSNYRDSGEQRMPLSALYNKIANENLLPGATVITTTRPTAVSSVRTLSFNRTYEILGFASEQVEEYVEKFTEDAAEDAKDAGEKIWEHIKTNMNIFSLCYIPVNCYIVCSCLLQVLKFYSEKGVGLPTKLTEIYQIAMKLFFFRHNEQYRDKPLSRKEIGSKDLPPEVEEKFKPLAKLAFDGLAQRKLIFGTDEVGDDLVRSALFHQLPDRKTGPFTYEPQFCFIHLTMQEFLAAKHITDTMKGAELRKFVADHINKGEWQVVIQFVAGLLGDGDEQSIDIFTDLLPKTTEEKAESELMFDYSVERRTVTCWPTDSEKHLAVTLMKCLHENNASNSIVQSKLEEIGFNAVDFRGCSLAPADCTAVVHFLKSFKQISRIDLSDNNIGSLGCIEIVKLFDNGNCNLSSLNLSYNDITEESMKHLCKALEQDKCNLSSLNLAYSNITEESMKYLCKALEQDKCNLSSLNLAYNNITEESMKHLCKALEQDKCNLSNLNLHYSNITEESMKHLCKALEQDKCNLSRLDLGYNDITEGSMKYLCKALEQDKCNLSSLNLENNNITDESMKHLCKALEQDKCNLSSLNLADNNITDESMKHLCKALEQDKCNLRSLTLAGNNIRDESMKHLCKALEQDKCNLSSLNLAENNITDESMKHLCKALEQDKCNLSSLNLAENNITDESMKYLCKALEQDKCNLSSLNLARNNITDQSIKRLSKALVNNNKLRRLYLHGNPKITNEAVKQFREANPNCLVIF